MTYHYKYWTAFLEADLLEAGDHSINNGDTFTMPTSASVTLAAWDNDSQLSGDKIHNENADDTTGQNGWVHINGQWVNTHSDFYVEKIHRLEGSDGKTYYLAEIEGSNSYNAPGAGDDFFSFVGETPPAGVSLTVVGGSNSNGVDYSDLSADPSSPPSNNVPAFTNAPSNGVIHVDENETMVIDLDASDADGDTLTYEIVGGRDASFFEIDAHTGVLTFKNARDFENPQSGGGSNTYDVTVKVSDGNGGEEVKPLWVKVQDVEEDAMDCIVIEAEDMHKWNFSTVHGSNASGGELVKINHLGQSGDLSTSFSGSDGTYTISVFAQDESDGQSVIMVKVNGEVVGTINLDNDNNGGGSNNGHFSEFTIEGVELKDGDDIQLWAQSNCGEFVRIDKIKLQQTEADPEFRECDDPNAVNIDFEGLAAGTVVATQYDGVMISAQKSGDGGSNSNSPNDAMVFDGANPTGGDTDLTASGDKVLIVSEDNDSSDPDDNAGGGTIWFKFDNPAYIYDIKVLDAEEGGTIRLLDENGALIQEVAIPGGTDGGIQQILLDVDGVAQIDLTLNGSGAIDDLCYVPGEPATGALAGRYFCDENDDNVDNGEPGVAGAIITLFDAAGNVVATTTTDADGNYRFDDLAAGDYTVGFENPDNVAGSEGKVFVAPNQGNDDGVDSDVINDDGLTAPVTVVSGETTTDVDGGIKDPGTASLAGRIFMDSNDDDQDDNNGDEMGVAGVTVTLKNGAGAVITTTTTGADGSYLFDNLNAGDYIVDFPTEVDGKVLVNKDVGPDVSDSDADQGNGETDVISLAIGEDKTDVDAGIEDPGTAAIEGKVFMDNDDDSLDGAGDMPVGGVTVELLNGDGTPTGLSTTTAADGTYSFTGLDAGDYIVQFPTDVDGKVLVTQDVDGNANDTDDSDASETTGQTGVISVDIGETSSDNDAGVEDPGTASLGDTVFFDENGDGVQNGGEGGVEGVTVTLTGAGADGILGTGDDTTATDVTDANGNYGFDGLDAGDYKVTFDESTAGGLVFTTEGADADDAVNGDSDADQTTGMTDVITLDIGEDENDIDAGLVDPALSSIAGRIFMDNNDNSLDDNEMGVGGVTVILTDGDGNFIDDTTTAADGSYLFDNLSAGDYKVEFPTEIADKILVDKDVDGNANDVDDSDADQTTGATDTIVLGINEDVTDVDAGVEDPGTASVGNLVFLDNNGNGVFDAGDDVVEGVTVELLDSFGDVIATETTDVAGNYLFDGLDAGIYSVRFVKPDDLEFTLDNPFAPDAANNDSDANPMSGETAQFELSIGEAELDIDAGLVAPEPASVGDTVFIDANGNGIRDDGEAGLEGVTVTLTGAGDDGIIGTGDDITLTEVTDSNGNYLFEDLEAGDYKITFDPTTLGNFVFTSEGLQPDAVLNNDSDADEVTGMTDVFSLVAGQDERNIDAGVVSEDPNAVDDMGAVCATESTIIDVLANDTDAPGETISIAHIEGVEVAAGDSVTLGSGATVTLNVDGTLSYDSSTGTYGGTPAAELLIGSEAMESFSYSITDGLGGTATADVDVKICGALNTIDTIKESLPDTLNFGVGGFFVGDAYTALTISSDDARFDNKLFEQAYCLERSDDIVFNDASFVADVFIGMDGMVNSPGLTSNAEGNFDLINWIINQDFASQSNGDTSGNGVGQNYTDTEIQSAIWGLTDGDSSVEIQGFDNGVWNGTSANAQEILDLALANGGGYVPGEGDLVTVVLVPQEDQTAAGYNEANDFDQSFIIALPFDDLKEDCIC